VVAVGAGSSASPHSGEKGPHGVLDTPTVVGAAGAAEVANAAGKAHATGAVGATVSAHSVSKGAAQAHAIIGAATKQAVKCAVADADKGSYTTEDGSRCCSPCSTRTSVFCRDTLTIACGVIGRRIMSLPFQCS
jgi:hypothetical protein